MFDLKKFLTENKLTRNSVLLENDNAPSLTIKDMKSFDPRDVEYNGELDNYYNPTITYKNHKYQLEFYDQNIEDYSRDGREAYGSGEIWFHTKKIPDAYFKFSAGFEYDGDSWIVTDIDDLEQVEIEPSWEIDVDSDEIPDEEEFDFGDELNERDLSSREEKLVKSLKKQGYKKDDPELYKLAAGLAKKNMKEVKGPELVNTISMIGGTLSKIEQMMDFGTEQSPEIAKGLDTVLSILINIQSDLESDRRAGAGPASDYYLENIIKRK